MNNSEPIEIIKFFLKFYDLWRLPNLWMGMLLCGWVGGLLAGVLSNH